MFVWKDEKNRKEAGVGPFLKTIAKFSFAEFAEMQWPNVFPQHILASVNEPKSSPWDDVKEILI